MEESPFLTRQVSSFENLLIIAIVGGTPRILYGNAEKIEFTLIDSREEQRVIIFDFDNEIVRNIIGGWNGGAFNIERYKRVLFKLIKCNGETLSHYLATVQGLDQEQRLEPETDWEFRESHL